MNVSIGGERDGWVLTGDSEARKDSIGTCGTDNEPVIEPVILTKIMACSKSHSDCSISCGILPSAECQSILLAPNVNRNETWVSL